MEKKLKAAIVEEYAELCRHRQPTYDGDSHVCQLKERRERCINLDKYDMLLNCPRNCPHFPKMEKVLCTPQKCPLAANFVKCIENRLN